MQAIASGTPSCVPYDTQAPYESALTLSPALPSRRYSIRFPFAPRTRCTAAAPHVGERAYSMTKMFFLAQISLRIFGHTLTLTSPRCALWRSSIWVRDWPIPPPIERGVSPLMIPL